MRNMRGKIRLFILISVYTVLILADGLLTYLNTPDLSREANPLVSVLGLGWGSLFLANFICFILLIVLTWYSFVRYQTVYTNTTRFTHYISQIVYNRPDKFIWMLYKLPKNWGPVMACMGYCFCYSLIVARLILVLEWLATTFHADLTIYNYICNTYFFGRLDVVVAILLAIILMFFWFYKEYRKQRKQAII